jgi:hypothetical protein
VEANSTSYCCHPSKEHSTTAHHHGLSWHGTHSPEFTAASINTTVRVNSADMTPKSSLQPPEFNKRKATPTFSISCSNIDCTNSPPVFDFLDSKYFINIYINQKEVIHG